MAFEGWPMCVVAVIVNAENPDGNITMYIYIQCVCSSFRFRKFQITLFHSSSASTIFILFTHHIHDMTSTTTTNFRPFKCNKVKGMREIHTCSKYGWSRNRGVSTIVSYVKRDGLQCCIHMIIKENPKR